jgi:hypothetical protein
MPVSLTTVKRTLDFKPSLQIASQSSLDCSEAAGLVSSIYDSLVSNLRAPTTGL